MTKQLVFEYTMEVRSNEWHEMKECQELICTYYRGHDLVQNRAVTFKCEINERGVDFSVEVHFSERVKFLEIQGN